jgi:hypothetical protein
VSWGRKGRGRGREEDIRPGLGRRGRAAQLGLGRFCSVGRERSEAREGRREVRGERRGKEEIEQRRLGEKPGSARLLGLGR